MLEEITPVDETNDTDSEGSSHNKTPAPVPYSRFKALVDQKNSLAAEVTKLRTDLIAAESARSDAEVAARKAAEEQKIAVDAEVEKAVSIEAVLALHKQALSSIVDEATKDWPAELLAFDPGIDVDPLKRVDWMKNGKAMAEKLRTAMGQSSTPGAAPKPQPANSQVQGREVKLPVDVKRSF